MDRLSPCSGPGELLLQNLDQPKPGNSQAPKTKAIELRQFQITITG